MKNISKKDLSIVFILIFVVLYLTHGTGLHGDDYAVINRWSPENFFLITPENLGLKISGVPDYLLFWWIYPILGKNYQWSYDLIKWLGHISAIYMAWRFFNLFLDKYRALAASVFFILSPLHETTTYWYMTTPYIFWPGIIMFSYYLLSNNRVKIGFLVGALGAFSGYWSPPYTFGLGLILFLKKDYIKGAIFISPGILYILYYFYLKLSFPFTEGRINPEINIVNYFQNIIMQILGIIDSLIGPSMILKVYYSALSIDLISITIAAFIFFLIWININKNKNNIIIDQKFNSTGYRDLLIGAVAVLLLSLGMFALTGLYVPSPFNLGNRSLVYGSLIISVLLSLLVVNRKNLIFIGLIFILPVFGLSDYWKTWNHKQIQILQNIKSHEGLKQVEKKDILIVTNNIYTKLGPYSHIEFFSMPWLVSSIFKDIASSEQIVAINQTVILEGNIIRDGKYGNIYPIRGNIFIYDSKTNNLSSGSREDIERLIENRQHEIRHWVQFGKGTLIELFIVNLSPRLQYLFVK
jgi:hypothetical protein